MKRVKSQITGDIGEQIVLYLASLNESWIARKLDKDFGMDIELELTENNILMGQYVKIQVKATDKLQVDNKVIKYRLKMDFLRYCKECHIPIILVVIDLQNQIGYYTWMQEYITNININNKKSFIVNIPITNDFSKGLSDRIKIIASRSNNSQLLIDLKTCRETAFFLGNDKIYETLVTLSLGVAKTTPDEICKIINDIISLGNDAYGTYNGNKKTEILDSLCRDHGNTFSAQNIERMVIRHHSCSRVGINALGLLYDEYPEHIKSLNLLQIFNLHTHPNIWYYCAIREQYFGESTLSIISKYAPKFNIGGVTLYLDSESKEYFLSKYINRGDSAILDCLIAVI